MDTSRPGYGEAREALLRAAIKTVSKRGLRGLTYRAVAAEAGVSHGAVSHHFGSRDRLIEEALQLSAARAAGLASLGPGRGRIEDFLDDLPGAVAADEDSYAFQFELALESRRDRALLRPVHELYELYEEAIRRELERLGVDRDAALDRLVLAALEGLIFQRVAGIGTDEEVEAALARLRQLLAATAADPAGASGRE